MKNLKYFNILFLAVSFFVVSSHTVTAVGIAVQKDHAHLPDASAVPFVYQSYREFGRTYSFVIGGRTGTVNIEKRGLIFIMNLPSSFPRKVTNEEELYIVLKWQKDIKAFSERFPKSAPLLKANLKSVDDFVAKFKAGNIRYRGKWMTNAAYSIIQQEVEEQASKHKKNSDYRKPVPKVTGEKDRSAPAEKMRDTVIADGEKGPKTNARQQTVVAEGRGVDEVSALRNAFQEAVGQVVGLVVDSQTRIKNDEVIRDRILIASNGYISSFEKLASKAEGAVWLVKIRAVVERKSLIEKLEAERVTTSKPATANLFAEVASNMQAVEGSSQLLCDRLSEIQNSWSATAGKPSYDRVSGKLSVPINIMVDSAAYAVSSKRLVELLNKIALSKKRKILSGIPCKEKDGIPTPERFLVNFYSNRQQKQHAESFEGMASSSVYGRKDWKGYTVTDWLRAEDYDKLPPHAFWIWVCVSKRAGYTEWRGYAVDVDMAKVAPMLCPFWSLTASLKDSSGRVISHWEKQNLTFKRHAFSSCDPQKANGEGSAQPGFHPHWVSMGDIRHARSGSGHRTPWVSGSRHDRDVVTKSSWTNFNNITLRQRVLIAPMFLSLEGFFHRHSTKGTLSYWPKEIITSSFKISPDSILEVKDVEVKFLPRPWTVAK